MKVYEYGAHAPLVNADKVAEQMSKQHRYYNRLIEVERSRKVKYEALLLRDEQYAAAKQKVATLEIKLTEARELIKKMKQREKHEVATPIEDARAKALKKDLKEAYKKANAERKRVQKDADFIAALQEVNTASHQEKLDARAACSADGLYWGNYLVAEDAAEAAKKPPKRIKHKKPKKLTAAEKLQDALELSAEKLAKEGWMPKFKRWDGSGHLQVQVQHGISVKEALSCEDTRFQLVPVSDDAYDSRLSRKKKTYTLARMRIGSNPDKSPIWAEFHIHLHRPLPADGMIKRVHLLREPMAGKSRWRLQLSVESDEKVKCPSGNGAVGIDLGWRQLEDKSLRGAYWCDVDGNHGQLRLTPWQLSAITKADDLRSIRDRNMEELKAALAMWKHSYAEVPEWLREYSKAWHSWRAQARFAALARRWAGERFAGDEVIFLALSSWAKQDRHLWQWEVNQRDKALRARREQVRLWAAELATKYSEVVLEGEGEEDKPFDLRPLAEQAPPEEEQDRAEKARHNRVLTSPAMLRTCVIQAFLARDRNIRFRDRAGTTDTCFWCRKREERTEALMQTCSCGRTWDRDENAARNIVRAATGGPDYKLGKDYSSTKRQGKWKRRKEEKAAKEIEKANQAVVAMNDDVVTEMA